MVQVFALEEDLRPAERLAPALRVVDRRRAADEVLQLAPVFGVERGIVLGLRIGFAQLVQRVDQRFGNEGAAIGAEMATGIGQVVHV
ncbi:hypothetical protein D3C85_1819420 [compost metagenome]